MDILKHIVVLRIEDLVQIPMQSECRWPLFVSSRGLCSMPLGGQLWEPSSQTQ